MAKVRFFALSRYVQSALEQAEYARDENGVVIGEVPGADGFYAQGETFEETRENLREVIEGNIMLALQLGWAIPNIKGITIEERDATTLAA